MGKILKATNIKSNWGYTKVSRWIKIDYTIVSPNHQLADYADNSGEELWLNFFRYKGKQYALGQFMRLYNPIILEDGSTLSGVDCTSAFNPLIIEISQDGEGVRLWEEVKIEED